MLNLDLPLQWNSVHLNEYFFLLGEFFFSFKCHIYFKARTRTNIEDFKQMIISWERGRVANVRWKFNRRCLMAFWWSSVPREWNSIDFYSSSTRLLMYSMIWNGMRHIFMFNIGMKDETNEFVWWGWCLWLS